MNNQINDLKICVTSTGLGHVTRGVEGWAHDLGHELANRGHDVLLCKGDGSVTASYERVISCWKRDSGATKRLLRWLPHRIGWRIGLGSPYSVEQTTFAWNLLGLLRREQVDVLHLKDPQLAKWIQKASRLGLCDTLVLFGHGTEEPPNSLAELTHVHHLAPWHQREAEKVVGVRDHWCTIPNFVDTDRFKPQSSTRLRHEWLIPDDALIVTACSAIKRQHKRIDFLIDEFATLIGRRPDLPVWLVIAGGRSEETDELIELAHARLGDRVRFALDLPRNRMPEFHALGDVFVHGSLFEMFGTVLAEAQATGVPCIAHHHPVMEWVVGPGGVTVDLGVPGILAKELTRLLDDEQLRRSMGVTARKHCYAHFAKDLVIDQIIDHYGKIAMPKTVAA